METIWSYLGYEPQQEQSGTEFETELTNDTDVDLDVRKIQSIQRIIRAKLDRESFVTKQDAIRKIQLVVRGHQATKLLDELNR